MPHSLERARRFLSQRLSKVSKMGIKQIVGKGVRASLGLGKLLQRTSKAMSVVMKQDYYGLGYKPDAKEKRKMMISRREKRMSSLKGATVEREPMVFPYLRETFYSVGIEHDEIRQS